MERLPAAFEGLGGGAQPPVGSPCLGLDEIAGSLKVGSTATRGCGPRLTSIVATNAGAAFRRWSRRREGGRLVATPGFLHAGSPRSGHSTRASGNWRRGRCSLATSSMVCSALAANPGRYFSLSSPRIASAG